MREASISQTALLRMQTEIATLRFEVAILTFGRALAKAYNPDQPRVPAGNPDGGQWTSEGGNALFSDRDVSTPPVQFAGDITGFTRHGINQAINRGVSPGSILDAVRNPLVITLQPNGTTRYAGDSAVVFLNPAGQVVTVWPK